MNFKEYLNILEISYLDIGHHHGNYDAWYLKRDSNDVIFASEENIVPEILHNTKNKDFSGRIDHDKKIISIYPFVNNEERLNYVVRILKNKYPSYKIYYFIESSNHPVEL